jgi:hypothetical protein
MKSVLITHADLPLGRRIVKVLWHDPTVSRILALGEGAIPRVFHSYRDGAPPRFVYERIDLAPAFGVELFRSDALLGVDRSSRTAPRGRARGTADRHEDPRAHGRARLVLHHAGVALDPLAVALGSAFVCKLARVMPTVGQRLSSACPEVAPELRSWIDSDMLFNAEFASARLRVLLLRVPTVVASGGFLPAPGLTAGLRVRPKLRPAVFRDLRRTSRAQCTALHARRASALPLVLGAGRGPCILVRGHRSRSRRAPSRSSGRAAARSFRGPHLRYGRASTHDALPGSASRPATGSGSHAPATA